MHHRFMTPVVTMVLLLGLVVSVVADEGMWTFDNLPKQYLKEKYGFEPTDEWVRHVQLSSIRFNNGGSGSLVSPDGLVMTNHHVGQDAVHKLSSAAHDYVKNGFIALRRASEIPCKDLELNQLLSITDVTKEIRAAVGDLEGAEAADALRGAVATILYSRHPRFSLRSGRRLQRGANTRSTTGTDQ